MPMKAPVHRPIPNRRRPADENWGKGRGGRPWRRLRMRVLQRDRFLCQTCRRAGRITEGTEVDHVIPLSQGGTDTFDGLEAICGPCHRAKTAREAHGGPSRAGK